MQLAAALIVGVVAAALPAWRTARLSIIDGLRAVA
jgi:putative ABC transport system permease protein